MPLPAAARPFSDVPEDGTWGVLWPGYYGSFLACAIDGQWSLADKSDLALARFWLPDPFAGCSAEDMFEDFHDIRDALPEPGEE